jgi:hypothetical protein
VNPRQRWRESFPFPSFVRFDMAKKKAKKATKKKGAKKKAAKKK